jgi:hypothetical protein
MRTTTITPAALRDDRPRPALVAGFEPYDAGRTYTSFVDHPTATAAAFDEATYARLRAVKAALDPEDRFPVGRPIV